MYVCVLQVIKCVYVCVYVAGDRVCIQYVCVCADDRVYIWMCLSQAIECVYG